MIRGVKILAGLILFTVLIGVGYLKRGLLASEVDLAVHGPSTISQRMDQYGDQVASRLKPDFEKAGVAYPPSAMTLVVLKQEKRLELYAYEKPDGSARFIRAYPILAASGNLGPKLREGDGQVPEGIYGVESLNPNSHYHLALHVDYPNAYDREKARSEGRTELGGDIMIHGSDVSIGCVAMGDSAAEDIFVLAAQVGVKKIRLLYCPFDFRLTKKTGVTPDLPAWTPELYSKLQHELIALPLPSQ